MVLINIMAKQCNTLIELGRYNKADMLVKLEMFKLKNKITEAECSFLTNKLRE